jgi:hypothetical protein
MAKFKSIPYGYSSHPLAQFGIPIAAYCEPHPQQDVPSNKRGLG